MSPKVNTTLLSAAVISGLLVSAAPAQASEATDETGQIVSVAEQSTGPELLVPAASAVGQDVLPAAPAVTETRAGDEAAADPALVAPEAETAGTEEMAVDSSVDDSAVETPAPAAGATEEPAAPEQIEEAEKAQDTEAEDTQYEGVTGSAADDSVDFGYVVEGGEPDKVPVDAKSNEDQQVPAIEGADEWTDAQWREFFATEEGQEYLAFLLTDLLNSATSEDELEALLDMIWTDFPGDEQWLEEFMAFYFGEEPLEPQDQEPVKKPESKPAENPVEIEPESTPSEKPVDIKPAGVIDKKPENSGAETAKLEAKPQASANALADTGLSSALLAAAAAGLLLMIAGAAMVLRRRKA